MSTQGPAHTRGAAQFGWRRAGLAWPGAQAFAAAAAPVAERYGGEGRPRRGARGPGEDGGASDSGCRAARRSEVEERRQPRSSSRRHLWRPQEGTRREARRRAGSGEVSHPGAPLLGVRRRAHGKEQGTRQRRRRAASMRGDHVGKRSNRWRAPVWTWWSAVLGQLRADLVHGPKTKFSVLGPLYIFH